MTTDKTGKGVPEAVARIIAQAQGQRRAYGQNPDPLPVQTGISANSDLVLSPEEILEECSREPETDIGNGRRLLNRFGDRLRHVTHVGWHAHDGMRWKEDSSGAVVRQMAHKTAELIDDEAIALDCSMEEQAIIEAGRIALFRMREMGKPPSVRSQLDDERIAELDELIEDHIRAKNEKIQFGNPKADWDQEELAAYRALEARIALGRDAIRERKKLMDNTSAWTPDMYVEYETLTKTVERMDKVEGDRTGRMSARHNHAKSSCSTAKINNMLTEAAAYLAVEVQELNCDLYAINCRSGTLRFYETVDDGKRVWRIRRDPHAVNDLISKLVECDFDGEAKAPLFGQFLQKVMPDPDRRAFLQRYLGYCLLGLTVEQCLLFFYGAGRNGKSTFIDLIVEIMGDYAVSMSIDSFAGDSKRAGAEATPDLARLPGARLVAASEPEMGVKLKDALIKTLTGGEVISVRRLHQDFFELTPQFKIILSGNHKPVIHDDSDGIWRRVHLVPWDIQIAEDEVDPDLPRKLRQEKAGIFAWMVRGALDYLTRGLQVPASVRDATAEYREESDPIGAFIRNGCHVTGEDGDRTTPEDLFNGYTAYAKREGLSEFKQATFSKRFPDQTRKSFKGPDGLMHQFRKGKSGTTIYYGNSCATGI